MYLSRLGSNYTGLRLELPVAEVRTTHLTLRRSASANSLLSKGR
jgi:hypothetical protein